MITLVNLSNVISIEFEETSIIITHTGDRAAMKIEGFSPIELVTLRTTISTGSMKWISILQDGKNSRIV